MAKKLALNGVKGVFVTDVLKTKKAEIESCDVLISINDVTVNSVSQHMNKLLNLVLVTNNLPN